MGGQEKFSNYIKGSVKTYSSTEWRKIINISINVLQLELIMNDQWYANISLLELSEPDEYWNTHFIKQS